ncbi:MAG TPA: hypothetical protein VLH85_00325 [Levilinea sp.]|nr:hypothetical protein [Levilinea sp.]
MEIEFIHITVVGLFLLKIASGIWLRNKGRPIPIGLLNLHKFIALATIALLVMIVRRIYLMTGIEPLMLIILILATLFFLIAVISGGLLSLEKPAATPMKIVHKCMPVLTALAILLFFYLIFR